MDQLYDEDKNCEKYVVVQFDSWFQTRYQTYITIPKNNGK